MEAYLECRDRARQNIKVADHMLTMTYPLVKDPKLLIAVLENIFLALTNAVGAVLAYERAFKRIPAYQDNFQSKFSMFTAKIVPRYNIDAATVRFIAEVKELVEDHKNASTEFSRKGKYVMADQNYRLKALGPKELKAHLATAKKVTYELLELVSKNDAIIGRR